MSLRALGCLLGRRFSPRARVLETLGLAALHRPLRPVHNLRDLDVGDGGGISALATAGWIGIGALIGILYSKSSTMKKRPPIDDPTVRAKFTDEAGKVAWLEYLDYINFLRLHPEVTDKKVHDEMMQRRYVEKTEEPEEGMSSVDETAMKARFEEWMKQFGRTYENEEDKVMRYELFKACAIRCDKTNASTGSRYAPNDLADWTEEELYGPCDRDDSYWEEYANELIRTYAQGWEDSYWIDSAGQRHKILKARKVGMDAARKAEQAAATRKTKGGS